MRVDRDQTLDGRLSSQSEPCQVQDQPTGVNAAAPKARALVEPISGKAAVMKPKDVDERE
jgi:hypothetical protein